MQHDTTLGIIQVLYDVFGDSIKCYPDFVEQELLRPAFYIICIDVSHKQRLGNNYRRSQSYDIHYFPQSEGKGMAQEFSQISEKLYGCLEYISVNGKTVRGLNMRVQVQEDVLHFFVDFDLSLVKQVAQEPYMADLNAKGGIKIDSKKE